MKAYLYKAGDQIADDYIHSAYLGFCQRGIEVVFVGDPMEVPSINLNKQPSEQPIFIGSIEDTKTYFNKCGIEVPKPLHIPECLIKYCDREIKFTTLGELKSERKVPLFIKSIDLKLFPSGVIRKESSYDTLFPYPDDTKIITSEVVNFSSEYRVFINKGQIVGIKNYTGDCTKFPYLTDLPKLINDYENAPISYTIDLGIMDDNDPFIYTSLIELNDGWSLGSYGLDPQIYTRFLMDRWFEIIYNKK